MSKILIIENNLEIREGVTESFNRLSNMKIIAVNNHREATEVLKSQSISLLIFTFDLKASTEIRLFNFLINGASKIPCILFVKKKNKFTNLFGTNEEFIFLVEKPTKYDYLVEASLMILHVTGPASPNCQAVTLSGFLALIKLKEESYLLEVTTGQISKGHILVHKGELVDVEYRNYEKNTAIQIMLQTNNWHIRLRPFPKDKKEFKSTFSLVKILGETTWKVEDYKEPMESDNESDTSYQPQKLGDTALKKGNTNKQQSRQAVELYQVGRFHAEGLRFGEAKKAFKESLILKKDDWKTWFWYSRVLQNTNYIENSLNNALILNPSEKKLQEEKKILTEIQQKVGDEKVRRCFFCWSPIEKKALRCNICWCHQFVHKNIYETKHVVDVDLLRKGQERYKRVIAREENAYAHYCMGMVRINQGDPSGSLSRFEKAMELYPGSSKFLSKQLKLSIKLGPSEGSGNAGLDQRKKIDSKRGKILVVEDSSTTRKVIVQTLVGSGYKVNEAADGLEAMSKLYDETPILVLLDIILPKMDGYSLLSVMKKNDKLKDIPVIMLTGKTGLGNRIKGRFAGASAYLTKPFKPNVLIEAIENHF